MLPFLGRSLGPKRARSHRNTVSSQRVNIVFLKQLVRRRVCMVLASSRCGGAERLAFVPPQRPPCSEPAYRLAKPDEVPTVEAMNPVRVDGGYGWNTRSKGYAGRRCLPW